MYSVVPPGLITNLNLVSHSLAVEPVKTLVHFDRLSDPFLRSQIPLQMPDGNKSNESNKLNALRFILRRGERIDRGSEGGCSARPPHHSKSRGSALRGRRCSRRSSRAA